MFCTLPCKKIISHVETSRLWISENRMFPRTVAIADVEMPTSLVASLAETPRLISTTTLCRSRLKPPGKSRALTIGAGGTTPAASKPCTPIDCGVGLGSKPCVAMSRLTSMSLNPSDGRACGSVSADGLRDRPSRSACRCDGERVARFESVDEMDFLQFGDCECRQDASVEINR
jgi:hypothetical protein